MEYIPTLEKQIMEILIYFDFQLVQDYMKLRTRKEYDNDFVNVIDVTPWKIYMERGLVIPTVEELKKLALDLMNKIIKLHNANPEDSFLCIQTGPFSVIYRDGIIQLDAVIESHSYD